MLRAAAAVARALRSAPAVSGQPFVGELGCRTGPASELLARSTTYTTYTLEAALAASRALMPASQPLQPLNTWGRWQSNAGQQRRWSESAAAAPGQPTAAAQGGDDASLAPCERQPQRQVRNHLDATLEHAAKAEGAAGVLAVIEREGEAFSELNVITALQQLAAVGGGGGGGDGGGAMSPEEVVKSRPFQTLVDMVLAGMMRFEPGLLAEVVRSCGQLGASEEMLLDEIGRHIMREQHLGALAPADIAALAWGYAALDHSPGVLLFEALAARAAAARQRFTPGQRRQVAEAFERLGYGSKVPRLEG